MKYTIVSILIVLFLLLQSCNDKLGSSGPSVEPEVPTVTTVLITNITASSVTGGGNVTDQGSSAVTARGVCWSTSYDPTTSNNKTKDGNGTGGYTSSMTGLKEWTLYHVRAYATNGIGTGYGNEVSFRTLSDAPIVTTTDSIKYITGHSATGGGNVNDQGSSAVTARGVCWSTSHNPTTSNSKTIDGSGTGNFTSLIPGLTAPTLYYVRAYATNSTRTSYGNEVAFRTKMIDIPCPGKPSIVYEGKTYNTVQIEGQCWLKENLDVGRMIADSGGQSNNGTIEKYCFNNDPARCTIYGGLYQWDEAMQYSTSPGTQGICPTGWHIPTLAQFDALVNTVGRDGNALISIGQGSGGSEGKNLSGFSALLAGYHSIDSMFCCSGYHTYFWSSTQDYGLFAYYMHLLNYNNYYSIDEFYYHKSSGFSVRCLKD